MTRKPWLAVAMLAAGVTLLAVVGIAGAATGNSKGSRAHSKTGGTMNINLSSTDFDFLDPSLAFADWSSGQFGYLMGCKLLNYPDKAAPEGTKLQPEAADFPVVSKGGTVYTFTIKKDAGGCKFNTGEAVTAQSFADAINRNLNPTMTSPAVQVHHRHRRRRRRDQRQGDDGIRCQGQRQQADRSPSRSRRPTSSRASTCRSSRPFRRGCRSTRRARRRSPRPVRTTSSTGRRAVRPSSIATRSTRARGRTTSTASSSRSTPTRTRASSR